MYHLADSLAEFVVFTEFRKQARIFPGRCTFLLPASYACNIGDGKIRYSLSASTIPCTDLVLRGIYVSTSGSLVQRVKAVVSHLDLGSGRLNRHHRHSYAPQRLIRTRGCTLVYDQSKTLFWLLPRHRSTPFCGVHRLARGFALWGRLP